MANLGEQIDIHTGGIDNIFPHHENEIAQSEGATGKQFVKYWMHNEWVLVNKKKMAKSENNFYILKNLLERNINPLAYRFWLLMANYRTKINFIWEALEGAEKALGRLYGLYLDFGADIGSVHQEYQNKFKEYLEDDLDTPRALSLLWDVFKDKNMSPADKKATILDFYKGFGLGFEQTEKKAKKINKEKIPEKIQKLAKKRKQARLDKDYKKSDELRKKINSFGYGVKDTASEQKIFKI